MRNKISIIGSTGSIGDTVFKLLKDKKEYNFYILSGFKNLKKIEYQIKNYKPKYFIVFDEKTYLKIKKKYKNNKIKILNSSSFFNSKFKQNHVAISAIPGIAGLKPTLKIMKFSKTILVANKESIICGWDLLKKNAIRYKTKILPIDSEHFSIMHMLESINKKEIEKIYLTASGGPFLNHTKKMIKNVKPSEAIKHPKWKMGKKISIDSATLMNKLFEVIEAQKLFSINYKKIDIVIHPQSLVHAIIKLKSGLYKLLYFETDMAIPIGNVLFGKNFEIKKFKSIKGNKNSIFKNQLTFINVDKNKFPAFKLKPVLGSYNALPIILNAANEIFVDQFIKKNISFYSIIDNLFVLLKDPKFRKYAIKRPSNLETILTIDKWTRDKAMEILKRY